MTYTAFRVLLLPLMLPEWAESIPANSLIRQVGPGLLLIEVCVLAVRRRLSWSARSAHWFGFYRSFK